MSQHIETEPDWSGIRAATIAVGVREAARQASAHLPVEEQRRFTERVMKRCSREGWLVQANTLRVAKSSQSMPLSANVRTGAEVVANTLRDRQEAAKLNLTKWIVSSTEHLSELTGKEALAAAPGAKLTADTYSKIYPEQATPGMTLNLFAVDGDMTVNQLNQ